MSHNNYYISVSKVVNEPSILITSSFTFDDPVPFTIFIPAYSYEDCYNELKQDQYVLLRGQKDDTFNALATWVGEYTKDGRKILYADDQLMAAAMLAITNKDRVYITNQVDNTNLARFYRFNYRMTQQATHLNFNKSKKPHKLQLLSIDMVNRDDLDNFEDLLTQVRIANLIYRYLARQVRRHPHKLLTEVIAQDKLLQQQLAVVETGQCDQYRCRRHK